MAKTPSTKSYPGSSHVQLISGVQTTTLNQTSFGNNRCGKVGLRCATYAFNIGDDRLTRRRSGSRGNSL